MSSNDEEELDLLEFVQVTKNEEYLEKVVPLFDDIQFLEHFRISKTTCSNISEIYEDSKYYNKIKYGPFGKICAFNQILIFLWFAGHQTSSYRDVSDRFNITLSTLHGIVQRVAFFLSNLSPKFIKWPSDEEKLVIAAEFAKNDFLNVIGAIDGCHIRIDKPIEDPNSYMNRKGFYSIHIQAVCDDQKKIIDVCIGNPGSVHDARIFRKSKLGSNLIQKCGHFILLGDNGYPLNANLMTPYKNTHGLTVIQKNFNKKLSSNRIKIEHTFGMLKQKFKQLYHLKLRNITLISHFIRACCVLYNMSLTDEFEYLQMEDENNETSDDVADSDPYSTDASILRDQIAANLPL
ncbi:putative nuclease HARBI1 [Ctenocephalides felis]|uniref:putative nuclease HARBI1 n=1 Tax=Ctenocephalides felis TaxID=7515 RepID=UPI000E6E59FB|nr:putative nuclease HARBI1 [Ctenocephalides felis]XP_026471475.1 putative nuclease HARBI1 [Ctenocephalides felis]